MDKRLGNQPKPNLWNPMKCCGAGNISYTFIGTQHILLVHWHGTETDARIYQEKGNAD